MTPETRRRRHSVRHRKHSKRQLKVLLLSLGLTGLVLGFILVVAGARGNGKLVKLGSVYVCGAAAMLGICGILYGTSQATKRE